MLREPVPQLSDDAKRRLSWMNHFDIKKNVRSTCRLFRISPSTFYHWKKKFRAEDPTTLEDIASRKPKTPKKTKWSYETLLTIERLIEHNPHTKNNDIRQFLARQNVQLSASTITRIMKRYRSHKEKHS